MYLNMHLMNTFKKKRLYKTLTIEEVAKKINVSPQVIKDLESTDIKTSSYPFVYYCAKSYAEYLNIDLPQKFLRHMPRRNIL